MSRVSSGLLLALAAILVLSCGGSSSPTNKATPAAGDGEGGLQPLRSGENAPGDGARPSLPPGHPPLHGASTPSATPSAGHVAGTIGLSPRLQGRHAASDVLYVIAKKDGATVAVLRIEKPTLPLDFELSQANAMMAGAAFEGPVDVTARLSKSGDAIPSSGDLEGSRRGVPVPSDGVTITIDRAHP